MRIPTIGLGVRGSTTTNVAGVRSLVAMAVVLLSVVLFPCAARQSWATGNGTLAVDVAYSIQSPGLKASLNPWKATATVRNTSGAKVTQYVIHFFLANNDLGSPLPAAAAEVKITQPLRPDQSRKTTWLANSDGLHGAPVSTPPLLLQPARYSLVACAGLDGVDAETFTACNTEDFEISPSAPIELQSPLLMISFLKGPTKAGSVGKPMAVTAELVNVSSTNLGVPQVITWVVRDLQTGNILRTIDGSTPKRVASGKAAKLHIKLVDLSVAGDYSVAACTPPPDDAKNCEGFDFVLR